jgi:hypothetical protein
MVRKITSKINSLTKTNRQILADRLEEGVELRSIMDLQLTTSSATQQLKDVIDDLAMGLTGAVAYSSAPAPTPVPEPTPTPQPIPQPTPILSGGLGTNLNSLNDYEPEIPFVDIFKQSRTWISSSAGGSWDDGRTFNLDKDGWIKSLLSGQTAKALMLWSEGVDFKYGSGDYDVTYTGTGTITYSGNVTVVSQSPDKDVIRIGDIKNGGFYLTITATDPTNYIRNISVRKVGATGKFTPEFIASLAGYRVLRFMDWGHTNNSTVAASINATATSFELNTRADTSDARYTVKGIPVEEMIELCNLTKKHMWLCIPHLATDAYVAKVATLIRNTLDKTLKVYVEYSNEVWNSMFTQASYCEAQGTGLASSPFESRLRWFARRTAQVGNIFKTLFAATNQQAQLCITLGAQASNSWTADAPIEYLKTINLAGAIDAIAIAPYFGGRYGEPSDATRVRNMTVAQFMADVNSLAIPEALNWVTACKTVATKHSKQLIAYEGGHHFVGVNDLKEDTVLNTLFRNAVQAPEIYQAYRTYLQGCKSRGLDLFVNFSSCGRFTKHGYWGVRQWMTQTPAESQRLRALLDEYPIV